MTDSKRIVSTGSAPAAIGPYSQAVSVGSWIHLSGQIPLDPATGELVEGDVRVQARRVLENLQAVLEAAEASLETVVKCTVYLADMEDYEDVNAVYAEFFAESKPARAAVEVSRLPKDVAVEIDAIAYRT